MYYLLVHSWAWGQSCTVGPLFCEKLPPSLQNFHLSRREWSCPCSQEAYTVCVLCRALHSSDWAPPTLTLPLNQKAKAYRETLSSDTVKTQGRNIDQQLPPEYFWAASPLIYRPLRVLGLKSFDLISPMR